MINAILSLDSTIAYIVTEKTDASNKEIRKFDLSQTSNVILFTTEML